VVSEIELIARSTFFRAIGQTDVPTRTDAEELWIGAENDSQCVWIHRPLLVPFDLKLLCHAL